jgi:ATP-dependent DNA helicase RecG
MSYLDTPIEFAKSVGPSRAKAFKSEIGVFSFEDLLHYFPFRYVDKSKFHRVADVVSDAAHVQLKGRVVNIEEVGSPRNKRLVATFEDDSGQIDLVWFKGGSWIKPTLAQGKQLIIFGKPNRFKGKFSLNHPEVELAESAKTQMGVSLKPIYGSTEGLTGSKLNSNGIQKVMQSVVLDGEGQMPEFLSPDIIKALEIPSRNEALRWIHLPPDLASLEAARKRLKFEELYLLQLGLIRNKLVTTKRIKGVVFEEVGAKFTTFFNELLQFELTGAQKRVVKEIRKDTRQGHHMNRLLQGDVGSGKTIVAMLISLLAVDNGFQVCVMAPTEILAQQHYNSFTKMLGPLDLEVRVLTGSSSTADRKEIHASLLAGECKIIVGTHALLEDKVKFQNLGLAVIDEQHRFGVKQRARLWGKAKIPPHVLVMTATPIPRTLAMTLYGDLDVSVIDELPPGRKPVDTSHRTDAARARVFGFIQDQIELGRQVYIVYPLIQESETLDYKDLMDGYESVARRFPLPNYRISIVHGQMKPEDKAYEMSQFVEGHTQIMVSTTVIEVGVDVPNASVMVIESAERFGLSQLHQLRGRVGRGADQSFCILMTGHKLSAEAKLRLETMVRTNDGFEVAEVDLKIRGPGDIMGTQQSGMLDLKIASLSEDQQLLQVARHMAEKLMDDDFELEKPENLRLRQKLEQVTRRKANWGLIS